MASSGGAVRAFFEPAAECLARYAEGSGDAAHTGTLLTRPNDTLFKRFTVAVVRILQARPATVFAVIALFAFWVPTVLDQVLAAAVIAMNVLPNHSLAYQFGLDHYPLDDAATAELAPKSVAGVLRALVRMMQ